MKVTIDAASKLIRNYSKEILRLDTLENSNSTIKYIDGETPLIPEYNLSEHQAELDRLNGNIERIRHAINEFNCNYVLPGIGVTIDVALVRMAVLSSRVRVIDNLRSMPKKSRATLYRSDKAEYTEPNFNLSEASQLYEKLNNELIAIQSALNLANVTNEIEVDIH